MLVYLARNILVHLEKAVPFLTDCSDARLFGIVGGPCAALLAAFLAANYTTPVSRGTCQPAHANHPAAAAAATTSQKSHH